MPRQVPSGSVLACWTNTDHEGLRVLERTLGAAPVFESCHPFSFFDYFRVPCAVRPALAADHHGRIPVPVLQLRIADESGGPQPSLLWCGAETAPASWPTVGVPGRYRLRDCTFFAHVALGT